MLRSVNSNVVLFAKELPIPLDELWFDYLTTPLKQGFRLDITAIRKESANAEISKIFAAKIDRT